MGEERRNSGGKKFSGKPHTFGGKKPYGERGGFGSKKPYGDRGGFAPRGEKSPRGDRPEAGKPSGFSGGKSEADRAARFGGGGNSGGSDRFKKFQPDYKKPGVGGSRKFAKPAPRKPERPVTAPVQEETESESFQLEGRNAIMEALKADRPVDTLLVKKGENEGTIKVIIAMAKEKNIVIKEMTKEKLDELSITGKHQGIIAYCAAHEYAEIEDIFAKAAEKNEQPFIILLDGITDPHNLGAIIRTANAAGAHGIVIPKRRSAGLTAVVGKTSAGALQYVPVARVANITAALEEMKKRGLWIACADMDGDNLYEAPLTGALGLVIGGEGSGISRLVKEKCDFSVKIPMMGEIGSLNASVAAGVIMYEVLRRRVSK